MMARKTATPTRSGKKSKTSLQGTQRSKRASAARSAPTKSKARSKTKSGRSAVAGKRKSRV